ncbi:MAG TPA: hypothetical protein VNX47_01735, partial [Nevskia sp.]|nr:hypothetical protein [Nevskia sp.]
LHRGRATVHGFLDEVLEQFQSLYGFHFGGSGVRCTLTFDAVVMQEAAGIIRPDGSGGVLAEAV